MDEQIKIIKDEPKKIELPQEIKDLNNEEIIKNLPEWSIEPPVEIKRGE